MTPDQKRRLDKYLETIKPYRKLGPSTVKKLIIQYRENGDLDAYDQLYCSLLKVSAKIAITDVEYKYGHCDPLEVISSGNKGIPDAIDKFDPDHEKGTELSSYASWWIKREIMLHVYHYDRVIKIPTIVLQNRKRARKLLAGGMTYDEVSVEMGISIKTILKHLCVKTKITSLSDSIVPPGEHKEVKMVDIIEDESALDAFLFTEELIGHMFKVMDKCLEPHEIYLITRRFGVCEEGSLTLEELAKIFNLSREAIRLRQKHILKKIRANWNPD